jgi:CoA:oxalate CoA-transferase
MKLLEGIRVLDLSRVLAGPYCTMILGDFGADVVKIEPPGTGDDSRAFGPFVGKESAYFMSLNRNKRSITLNLKDNKARELFKQMVSNADVVVENYRPGTMGKFGLGYEELKAINPRIIYAACSGFGHTGIPQWVQAPAYDVIVQGMGGVMSITGQEGGEPTRVGASIGDITAGLFTAVGVMGALFHRAITGMGQKVDVSMLDCQVAILENAIARYLTSGLVPAPIGNRHPSITPFEAFKTKDGYIIIAVGNDKLWKTFCDLIQRSDLVTDERFATNAKRTENQKQLKVVLTEVFAGKTTDEWIGLLEQVGIPCGPINTVDQIIHHPQIQARNMIVENIHPVAGSVKMAGVPVKFSETPGGIERHAPLLGQHTEEVLHEILGLNKDEVNRLKEAGVL